MLEEKFVLVFGVSDVVIPVSSVEKFFHSTPLAFLFRVYSISLYAHACLWVCTCMIEHVCVCAYVHGCMCALWSGVGVVHMFVLYMTSLVICLSSLKDCILLFTVAMDQTLKNTCVLQLCPVCVCLCLAIYLSFSCPWKDIIVSIDQSFKDQHNFAFEAGSHYAFQAALNLMILLSPPLTCWSPTSGRIDILTSSLSRCWLMPPVSWFTCHSSSSGTHLQFSMCTLPILLSLSRKHLICWHCCKW